jgi:hypothetical protein
MVNYIKSIILLFALSILSCKDTKLVIPKENNISQKLNLNGYYYLKSKTSEEYSSNVYFLYQNGILLNIGSPKYYDELTISNYINNEILKFKSVYKNKYYWGLYKVFDNHIEFEKWESKSGPGGRLKTVYYKGQILNNNSFKITNAYNNYQKKNYEVNDIYEFRPFSPKPDSTNTFIK